jgi:hypothetical protein
MASPSGGDSALDRVVAAVAPPRPPAPEAMTADRDLLAATGLERFAAAAERMQPKALYSRIAVPGGPPELYRAGEGIAPAADPWSLAPLAQAHVGPPPPAAAAGAESLGRLFVAGLPAGRYVLPPEAKGVRVGASAQPG